MDGKTDIWLVGNTGLRNPRRIAQGFELFAQSSFVGNLHGREAEYNFMRFLHDNGVINNSLGKDESASHARKWRLMFARHGLIYPKVPGGCGEQSDLGPLDQITPFGRMFLEAKTAAAQQECFLRAQAVEQVSTVDGAALFSPLRWILALMIELDRRVGTSEISRVEFALWGHTTDPTYDLYSVVDNILDLRQRRKAAPSKKVFDRQERERRGACYPHRNQNFYDYSDMNMRYLRATGVVQRKGRGLIISPIKMAMAKELAKSTVSDISKLDALKMLTDGAPLPSDDLHVALQLLNEAKAVAGKMHIAIDLTPSDSLTVLGVNSARYQIEDSIRRCDEVQFAEQQKYEWREIAEYIKLIEAGGGISRADDQERFIEVPKDETPAYLEWVLWRASLAIGCLENKPFEVRGFAIDSELLPVGVASGGRGDLYCEYDEFVLLIEATLSTSSRQEAMEGEPVRRHVSEAIDQYEKPVYCLFVANKVDINTIETFRHGVWYTKDGIKRRLNILPISLEQYRELFSSLASGERADPNAFRRLIDACVAKRDVYATPIWKQCIDDLISKIVIEYKAS